MRVYLSQTDHICQGTRSQMFWKNSFAASFMWLKLRREVKKVAGRWEKAMWGMDDRIVDKIM